jgi:Holliday junction resolvase RusA-like endonuclease
MIFKIPGRLPGLNEIIDAAKSHFGEYATMKETYTSIVGWYAKKLPRYTKKVAIIITWYEPNRRRDIDNIMAGQKFILDGLVQAGTIPNDSQRYIAGILHKFSVNAENPRIEVEVVEADKDSELLKEQELWD